MTIKEFFEISSNIDPYESNIYVQIDEGWKHCFSCCNVHKYDNHKIISIDFCHDYLGSTYADFYVDGEEEK